MTITTMAGTTSATPPKMRISHFGFPKHSTTTTTLHLSPLTKKTNISLKLSSSSCISSLSPLLLNKPFSVSSQSQHSNPKPLTVVPAIGYKKKTLFASAKGFRVSDGGMSLRRRVGKQHLLRKVNAKRRLRLPKMHGVSSVFDKTGTIGEDKCLQVEEKPHVVRVNEVIKSSNPMEESPHPSDSNEVYAKNDFPRLDTIPPNSSAKLLRATDTIQDAKKSAFLGNIVGMSTGKVESISTVNQQLDRTAMSSFPAKTSSTFVDSQGTTLGSSARDTSVEGTSSPSCHSGDRSPPHAHTPLQQENCQYSPPQMVPTRNISVGACIKFSNAKGQQMLLDGPHADPISHAENSVGLKELVHGTKPHTHAGPFVGNSSNNSTLNKGEPQSSDVGLHAGPAPHAEKNNMIPSFDNFGKHKNGLVPVDGPQQAANAHPRLFTLQNPDLVTCFAVEPSKEKVQHSKAPPAQLPGQLLHDSQHPISNPKCAYDLDDHSNCEPENDLSNLNADATSRHVTGWKPKNADLMKTPVLHSINHTASKLKLQSNCNKNKRLQGAGNTVNLPSVYPNEEVQGAVLKQPQENQ